MEPELKNKLKTAVWIGHSLFERGKTAGSTANMSFLYDEKIYITGSGTCFGTLEKRSFSVVDRKGKHIDGIKPSKEFNLHKILYDKSENIQAVIHTHSFYAVLWSCLPHENERDVIPAYTPYLKMKVGSIGLVPYAEPGSKELFGFFKDKVFESNGYLLKNHGPIIGDSDLMSAFYGLEELEESAKIAWHLKETPQANKITH